MDRNWADLRDRVTPVKFPLAMPPEARVWKLSFFYHDVNLFLLVVVVPVEMWVTLLRSPHRHRPGSPQNVVRRAIVQGLVFALGVVECHPAADAPARFGNRCVGADKNLFVFEAAPQALDKDVVQEPPLAIHTHPNALCFQLFDKSRCCELDTLVRVEDFGFAIKLYGFFQGFNTKVCFHGDR